MADGEFVTDSLCEERTAHMQTKLEQIARDAEETRRGVGNLNRRLFEGNGVPPFDVQVAANTEHRKRTEAEAAARKRHSWQRALTWAVAGAGWAVGLIIVFLQIYLR